YHRLDMDGGVDGGQLAGRRLGLGQVLGDVVFVEQDLPLKVVGLDEVPVNKAQVPDSPAHQGVGQHGAEGAAAAQGHVAIQQPALALLADAPKAHLPAVALQRAVRHAFSSSATPKLSRNSLKNRTFFFGQPSWFPKVARAWMSSFTRRRSGPLNR